MSDNVNNFAEAVRVLSSNHEPIQSLVYGAYINHLQGMDQNELPPNIRLIFKPVELMLTSFIPPCDIEARYIANDILYMADVVQSQKNKV